MTTKTLTGNYQVLSQDYILIADSSAGPFTVTLPDPSGMEGREYKFIRVNTGTNRNVTITPVAGSVVNLSAQYNTLVVVSIGMAWIKLNGA